ncbi:hypothetical protein ABZS66_14505 [Dactylosporangium sp. NPDC005572]|uniref:hypothetical protein n=1 Tax=Dactylosporangium sp. NPDC005572 TaxID=3156889 RepID=UPI00339F1DF7
MSDYELDWGSEDGLHVDHDGGVDHVFGDHQFDQQHDQHDQFDHAVEADGPDDVTGVFEIDGDVEDEPLDGGDDDVDLPDWQLDPDFTTGHYDMIGADPHEDDMWSQFMTDMHDEVNPYAAN